MRLRLLLRRISFLLFITSLLFAGFTASAQQAKRITGFVTDSTGRGIPNVTVSEKNTTNSTVTNTDGNFRLNVAGSQSVLVFTSVGYLIREVTVGEQADVSVQLSQQSVSLGEVVVIGYGSQRRADVTSAVATVKAENFVKGPVQDAGQLLQG